eukprot:scaffold4894_cov74-Skeletonema_dohrnii-CCMP3373.AAC.2
MDICPNSVVDEAYLNEGDRRLVSSIITMVTMSCCHKCLAADGRMPWSLSFVWWRWASQFYQEY